MQFLDTNNDLCIMRLNAVQEFSNDSFFDFDMEHGISHLTEYGVRKFGMPKYIEGMPESFASSFIYEEDYDTFIDMYRRLFATKKQVTATYRLIDGNGDMHWDEVVMIPVSDTYAIGYVRDITDKMLLEFKLQMMRQLTIIENLLLSTHRQHDGMYSAMAELACFLDCSDAFLFGIDDEDEILRLHHGWSHGQRKAEDCPNALSHEYVEDLKNSLSKKQIQIYKGESLKLVSKKYSGLFSAFPYELKCLCIIPITEAGDKLVGFISLLNPVNIHNAGNHFLELVQLSFSHAYDNIIEQQHIEMLNSYDLSTKLLNRNKYLEYIRNFSAKGLHSLGCIVIDVNGLHEYNSRYGHLAGDELLIDVANALRQSLKTQYLFRTGGDEFIAICPDEETDLLKKQIQTARIMLEQKEIYVSAGLEWRTSDIDLNDMLKASDRLMYEDKDKFYIQKRCRREME